MERGSHYWRTGALVGPEHVELLDDAGFDFIELNCTNMRPEVSADQFARLRDDLASCRLKVEVCSGFLPRDFHIVGPAVGWDRFTESVQVEAGRAAALGAQLIVWANGPSRTVPDGFPRAVAKEQLCRAGSYIASVARGHHLVVAFEALNSTASNFILLLEEALEVVAGIGEAEIGTMADMYHMAKNGEDLTKVALPGSALWHVHVCDSDRRPPGSNPDESGRYRKLAKALRDMNYKGRISIEANWSDLAVELPRAMHALEEWMELASPWIPAS